MLPERQGDDDAGIATEETGRTAVGADDGTQPKKRPKTGGRKRISLDEKLKLGRARSEIASWHDDTTVDIEIAALFLGKSKTILEKMIRPGGGGPPIMKPSVGVPKGRNQDVQFKLGDLREWQRKNKATDNFDAAVKAGLAGWMTIQHPFFELIGHPTPRAIAGDAWNMRDPLREKNFAGLLSGKFRIVWLTLAEASVSRWADAKRHRAFAANGLRLIQDEGRAIQSSIEATEIALVLDEKSKTGRQTSRRRRNP